jgi:hypothetical protein
MKKLFVLMAVALAGLLVFTACPTESKGGGIRTSALKTTIKKANDEKYGVKEADAVSASEVPTGVFWVTKAQMIAFNTAIKKAEAVRDNPLSQSSVNAAKVELESAITVFKEAKQEGTAAAITLSGTITIKHNGKPVPYVEIWTHDSDWGWMEMTRFASSGANTPWSIIIKPFSEDTEIFFRVAGYADDTYYPSLFNLDVKGLTKTVRNTSISNITINMENLNTFTLSGTISGSYDGRIVPSMSIQAYGEINNENMFLGEAFVFEVGDNRPWSMVVQTLESNTKVTFGVWGFDGPAPWVDEQLLFRWGMDFGVTVKDQDKSDVAIICHVNAPITLSGTIKVTYDGEPVPKLMILAEYEEGSDMIWLGETNVHPTGETTPWSITREGFSENKVISFFVRGYSDNEDELFGANPEQTATVKDKDTSNIALDLGDLKSEEP